MASTASKETAAPSNGGKASPEPANHKQVPRVPFDTASHWENEDKLTADDRRDRCKGISIITLKDIPTWADHAELLSQHIDMDATRAMLKKKFAKYDMQTAAMVAHLSESKRAQQMMKSMDWDDADLQCALDRDNLVFEPNEAINRKVSLWIGDITTLELDSIVNAANMAMRGGGGIDGRIHQMAGPTLLEECIELNGCPCGLTKATRGHNLPCRYILHTVGPRVQDDGHPLPVAKLTGCYTSILEWVGSLGLRSVAFCAISTGIFRYPLEAATHTALKTVREWLEEGDNINTVDRVVFCVYGKPEWDMYEKLMQLYFPPVYAKYPHSLSLPSTRSSSSISQTFANAKFEDVETFIAALHQARGEEAPIVDLSGLAALINNLEKADRKKFFATTLPSIVDLVNRRKEILSAWDAPNFPQSTDSTTTLTALQLQCVLACAFVGIMPDQSIHTQEFVHFSFTGLWKHWDPNLSASALELPSLNSSASLKGSSKPALNADAPENGTDDGQKKKKKKRAKNENVNVDALAANAAARFKAILTFFETPVAEHHSVYYARLVHPPLKDREFDWRKADNKLVPIHLSNDPVPAAPAPQVTLLPVHALIGRDLFTHVEKLSNTDRLFFECPEMLVIALLASSLLPNETIHIVGARQLSHIELSTEGLLTHKSSKVEPSNFIAHAVLVPQPAVTLPRHERSRWYIFSQISNIMGCLRTVKGPLKIACGSWVDPVFKLNASIMSLAQLLSVTAFETLETGQTWKDKKHLEERLANCPELFLYDAGAIGTELTALAKILESQLVQYDVLLNALIGVPILDMQLANDNTTLVHQLTLRFQAWKKEYKEYVKRKEKERKAREKELAKKQEAARKAREKARKELEKARKVAEKAEKEEAKEKAKQDKAGKDAAQKHAVAEGNGDKKDAKSTPKDAKPADAKKDGKKPDVKKSEEEASSSEETKSQEHSSAEVSSSVEEKPTPAKKPVAKKSEATESSEEEKSEQSSSTKDSSDEKDEDESK